MEREILKATCYAVMVGGALYFLAQRFITPDLTETQLVTAHWPAIVVVIAAIAAVSILRDERD